MRKIRSLVVFMLTFLMGIYLFACSKTGNFKFSRIDWKEDGSGATVILVDESDSSKEKEVSVEVTLKEHKDATCDEMAKNIYTITYEGVTYTKEIAVGKALGHEWEFQKFEWSADSKSAKAVLVCKKDSTHTKEVEATVTAVKKTDPTCGENGVTTYTATYETHTETKDVADIEMLEHEYQFDHFSWNDDYTAKAILVCKNDSTHIKEKNAVVESKIIKAPTCEEKGLRQYTATYLTFKETKDVEVEALGHNYQFDHFNWAEDSKSAVAVLVCKNNSSHTKEEAATVTSIIKTHATCEQMGVTTYTATYETRTEAKDVTDIEILNHDYKFDHIEWSADYKNAKAIFVCQNDSNHTKDEALNVAIEEFANYTQYTVTYGDYSETRKVSKDNEEIYTVDFRNADNELISTADYKKGETVLVPENPTKAADNTYTYKFVGWDKEVSTTALGSVTYKAVYEKTYIEYEVKFVNYDGEEISKANYHYGDEIAKPTTDPEHPADNTYTYLFAGWNQMGYTCTGNKVYTAMYRPVYIEYEITFVNFDDKEISTKKYHYDDEVVVPANPTREANNTYTYEFAGWDSEVSNVNGNKVYKATYKSTYIDYVVEFVDAETKEVLDTKTYHYNDELVAPTTFTKEKDNTYTYAFDKIDGEVATKVTENVTYAVIFTKTYIEYEIIFETEDHKEISKTKYHYGDDIVFPTENPEKEADNTYTYLFAGWNQMSTKCIGNKTYTAMYRPVYIEYEITFVDYNDKEISTKKYHYDDVVAVPETPTRASDNTYTYEFKAWDSEVTKVDGAKTYKAVYEATYIEYEITFVNFDDKEISTKKYHYDDEVVVPETPTRASDNTYTYEFKAWDSEVTKVDGTKTYKAVYEATYIEYEITFVDYNDKEISTEKYHYGAEVSVPESPTRSSDSTYTYEFTGWTPTVTKVDGAATYTATYKEEFIVYTVIFLNYDGKEFARIDYHYGEDILLEETPEKPADEVYRYEFSMWSSETVGLVITYTPVYTPFYIDYEIVFVDYDDKEVSKDNYHYGAEVNVPESPTRDADNTYTYEFAGWSPTVTKVDGAATYTATYKETYIEYTVTFMDGDKTVSEAKYHYNDNLEVPADLEDYKTDTVYYEFDGWDKDVAEKVTESVTYNATYYMTLRQEHNVISYEDVYNYVYNGDKIFEPSFNILDREEYILEYSIKGEDDFTTEAPSELGEYTLRVTVPENNYYLETIKTYDLVIAYKNNTFVNIGTYEFPDLLVEFNKFGKLIKAVGRSDLGYKFIDEYDIDGITPKGLVELYNEVLLAENYDKLAAYYKKANSFYIPINVTNQLKGNNYIEDEIDEAISNLKNPACDYDVYGVELGNFYLGSYMTLLGANNIDDIEERYDDIIDTLSLTNSYEVTAYYLDSLEFHILYTVSNYYLGLLEQINSTDAENYIKQINSYRDLKNTDYLDDYNVYYLNPYYTTLLVQYNDSVLGLKRLLTYFKNESGFDYYEYLVNKNHDAVNAYNLGEESLYTLYDAYAKNVEDFYGFINESDFLELISNLYDEKDLLAAIELGFDNAKEEMLILDKAGNAQNVYYLDQRIIVGTNKYHYVDEYAEITYLFNEYNFMDKTYYLGYIIDGAYSKEEALDSSVEKDILDIFLYQDNNGYIEYFNYKGLNAAQFNFKTNEFRTCKGELVHIAYIVDYEGSLYTIRLNKSGDELISYSYGGYWTLDEIVKRVTEPIDDHFGEDTIWWYDGEFVMIAGYSMIYKFEIDPNDPYILKEYQIEFDYKDVKFNYFYENPVCKLAFVTINNDNYVFMYSSNDSYDDIEAGTAKPYLGLNGVLTWCLDGDTIFTPFDEDSTYIITPNGLERFNSTDVRYEETAYSYDSGEDHYEYLKQIRYNGFITRYVIKNGQVVNEWDETENYVFVKESSKFVAIYLKEDGNLIPTDIDNVTKKLVATGLDINEDYNFVLYNIDGYQLCYVSGPSFLEIYVPEIDEDTNGIIIHMDEDYYFMIEDDELIQYAPKGTHIVTLINYDDIVWRMYIVKDGDDFNPGLLTKPTRPYDNRFYYSFMMWVEKDANTYEAIYNNYLRDEHKVMVDDFVPRTYSGKSIPEPDIFSHVGIRATVEYKLEDADDDSYQEGMPTEVGVYILKLTFAGSEMYKEKIVYKEFRIELPYKQMVVFNYLSPVYFVVDEAGCVEEVYAFDMDLAHIFEKELFCGLNIVDATRALINSYAKHGYFALRNVATTNYPEDDEITKYFNVDVYSIGIYDDYFMNLIDEVIDEEFSRLKVDSTKSINKIDLDDYLTKITLLSNDELGALSGESVMKYVLDNISFAEYKSKGFNQLAIKLRPIYMQYFEFSYIYNYLNEYNDSEYDSLKQAISDGIDSLDSSIDAIENIADDFIGLTSSYLYLRSIYYGYLKYYDKSLAQNADDLMHRTYPVIHSYVDMMDESGLDILLSFVEFQINQAKSIRSNIYANSEYSDIITDVLSSNNTNLEGLHNMACEEYRSILNALSEELDYDLEKMPSDINLVKLQDKEISYYLYDEFMDETWFFVETGMTDAPKICYVYSGKMTIEQYMHFENPNLVRFFGYDVIDSNKILVLDYLYIYAPILEVNANNKQCELSPSANEELKYVAYYYMNDTCYTFALYENDGNKTGNMYFGAEISYEDLSKRLPKTIADDTCLWFEKDGIVTIGILGSYMSFVKDEANPNILLEYDKKYTSIELKYILEDHGIQYAYVVADGANYVFGYYDSLTEDQIENPSTVININKAGIMTWEQNDDIVVTYINDTFYSVHRVKYDEDNKKYILEAVDSKEIEKYDVNYTYSNSSASYLFMTLHSYNGEKAYSVYTFNGVLTEEAMLQGYKNGSYLEVSSWSVNEQFVNIVNNFTNKVIKVFEIVDGKLQERQASKPQIIQIKYKNYSAFLIVDEHGIVTDAHGENDIIELIFAKRQIEGLYIKDALVAYLNALNDDGYFTLFEDLYNELFDDDTSDNFVDILLFESDDDLESFVKNAMNSIREDISIRWYLRVPEYMLSQNSIYTSEELEDMSEDEIINELITRYRTAAKYRSEDVKAFEIYFRPIYTYIEELKFYKETLEEMNVEKYASALALISSTYDDIAKYATMTTPQNDEWNFGKYINDISILNTNIYQKNKKYAAIKAALEAIQNGSQYEIYMLDTYDIFKDTKWYESYSKIMENVDKCYRDVFNKKQRLISEVDFSIFNAIYEYIFYNHNYTSRSDVFATINEAYEQNWGMILDLVDINVLYPGFDFICSYEHLYNVEYVYRDAVNNETLVFVKWSEDKLPIKDYRICYIFEGLYSDDELIDPKLLNERKISRFYSYSIDGDILIIESPYASEEIPYTISEGELVIEAPKSELKYIAYYGMKDQVFTIGLYEEGLAFMYYGKYSFNQIKSGLAKQYSYGIDWYYDGNSDLYVVESHGEELAFYLDTDDILKLVTIDLSDAEFVEFFEAEDEFTVVCVKDLENVKRAYLYYGFVSKERILSGDAMLMSGSRNNFTWTQEEDKVIVYDEGEAAWVFILENGEYNFHLATEIVEAKERYSYIGEDCSILLATVTYIDGRTVNNAYYYDSGTTYDKMVADYKGEYGKYNFINNWIETYADVYIVDSSNNKEIEDRYSKSESKLVDYYIFKKNLVYIYHPDNEATYACYRINTFNICYEFEEFVGQTDLIDNPDAYEYDMWLWDIDEYGRITLADFDEYFVQISPEGPAIQIIELLEFEQEPTIEYVLYDSNNDVTYILFVADDSNYAYVYGGEVTEAQFETEFPISGFDGGIYWVEYVDHILIYLDHGMPAFAVKKDDEFVIVDPSAVESYEIIYTYEDDSKKLLFAECKPYAAEPLKIVFEFELDASDEFINETILAYHEDMTSSTPAIMWQESSISVLYYEDSRYLQPILGKYSKKSNSNILVPFKSETKELKYYYYDSDLDYTYALYEENGLNICYGFKGSVAKEDFKTATISGEFIWQKVGSLNAIIIGAMPGRMFTVSDEDPTLLIKPEGMGPTVPVIGPTPTPGKIGKTL